MQWSVVPGLIAITAAVALIAGVVCVAAQVIRQGWHLEEQGWSVERMNLHRVRGAGMVAVGAYPAVGYCRWTGRALEIFWRSGSIALSIWSAALLAGCMNSATPQTSSSLATIAKPNTVLDLLQNVKLVAQTDSLFRRSFYEDGRLLQYFGGQNVKFNRSDKTIIGDILGFDEIVAPIPFFGSSTIPGMSIHFSWDERGSRDIETTLQIAFRKSTKVDFDDVVRVFGSSWKKAPVEPPILHRVYDRTATPHGNDVIIYEFRNGQATQALRVEFNGDATISGLYVKGRFSDPGERPLAVSAGAPPAEAAQSVADLQWHEGAYGGGAVYK